MLNKLAVTCLAAGATLAFAASNSYKVDILDNTTVAGKQVKAGNYKIEVENGQAILKHGKETIEVPAHTEQATSKYSGTQIQYVDNAMHEIRLGGTSTRIVFGGAADQTTGGTN